jgi:hypothetical protein
MTGSAALTAHRIEVRRLLMAVNVKRFKDDLDRLIGEGETLENAMSLEISPDKFILGVNKV